MKRFWVSWYEEVDETGDWRPFTVPPTESIPHYWCTGTTDDEPERKSICAVVDAENEEKAWEVVKKHWAANEERFMVDASYWFCSRPGICFGFIFVGIGKEYLVSSLCME